MHRACGPAPARSARDRTPSGRVQSSGDVRPQLDNPGAGSIRSTHTHGSRPVGRPRSPATEYRLLSSRARRVLKTDAGTAWNPSEAPGISHKAGTFRLEHLPDRLPTRARGDDAPWHTCATHWSSSRAFSSSAKALHPQPRCKKALPHRPDLVFDLPFLPARELGVHATGSTR